MSSDSTQFPAGPKGLPPGPAPRAAQAESVRARVADLPPDLQNISRAARLRGEVIEAVRDKLTRETVVTVRTDKGDVELRVPPDQPAPVKGEKVEIEIRPAPTPGQSPTQAIIRPTPEAQAPAPSTPAPPRPSATPVEVVVRPAPDVEPPPVPATPRAEPAPPWPREGAVVRLQPLPPAEAATLFQSQPLPEIIAATITEPAAQKAQVIAREVIDSTIIQTLNIPAQGAVIPDENSVSIPFAQPSVFALAALPQAVPPVLIAAPGTPALQSPAPAHVQVLKTSLVQIPPSATLPLIPGLSHTPPLSQASQLQAPAFQAIPGAAAQAAAFSPRAVPLDIRLSAILPPPVELTVPGTNAGIKNIAALLKHQPPAILTAQKPGIVQGIITGAVKDSLPVVTVPPFLPGGIPQAYVLQIPGAPVLAPGTPLEFAPLAQQPAVQPFIPGQSPLPPFAAFLTPGPWPALEQIAQALAATGAPALAQVLSNLTPSPANPAQLTPAALFFIAAVRGGDLSGWLGDKTIEALRQAGRGGLVSRLAQEGGMLSRASAEPVSQDWRAIPLPLHWQGEFHRVALYYKRDGQDEQENDPQKSGQTRFVFDLNLSRMGKVQLDGLARGARLDLILRTENPFSQAVQMDMRGVYATALRHAEMTGELSFQGNAAQWVTIMAEKQKTLGVSA